MQKYYNNLNLNGFDDINYIINETKEFIGITDFQLKQTGIDKPGDRAKILIRIQEKSDNFDFLLPKAVYYICNDLNILEHIDNDKNINNLYIWLKNLKMENYINNFIINGYHSIDLLYIQNLSKNPLTDNILMEMGINKIGYRARIFNKLKDESKDYFNKLKSGTTVINMESDEKICDCLIY